MGTDIHPILEIRKGGSWNWYKGPFKCGECDGTGNGIKWEKAADGEKPTQTKVPGGCYWCKGKRTTWRPMQPRNYDFFGILADVRNGSGFAGVDTGDGWKPIAPERGLPEDLNSETKAGLKRGYSEEEDEAAYNAGLPRIDLGDHSHTWCLLSELLAYNWDSGTRQRGVVSLARFRDMKFPLTAPPYPYSGGISGPGIVTVTPTEAIRILTEGVTVAPAAGPWREDGETLIDRHGNKPYVTVEWGETAKDAAGAYHSKMIPELVSIAEKEGVTPSDVRLVVGFDS